MIKMSTKLTLLGLVLLASNFAVAQNTVHISGKVAFAGNNKLVRVVESKGFERITLGETAINPDNTYSLTVTKQQPGIVFIDCCQEQNVRAWIEDEDLNINFRGIDTAKVKIKNPPFVYIQAGPKNELMNLSNFSNHQNYQNMIAISQTMYKAALEDAKKKDQILMDLYNKNNELTRANTLYLLEHYGHLTSSIALLSGLNPQKDADLIESTLAKIEKANPQSTIAAVYRQQIADKLAKLKSMEEGQSTGI